MTFDADGVSNFSSLHGKPKRPGPTGEEEKIKTQYAQAKIVDGTVFYDDQKHKLNGEVKGLSLELDPGVSNQIIFAVDNADVTFDMKTLDHIKSNLYATFDDKHAVVQSFVIESPVSKTTLQGEVTSIKDATYDFKMTSDINLAQTAKVFAPSSGLIGNASFIGHVTGKGMAYEATGEIKSDGIKAFNVMANDLNLTGSLNGEGKSFKFDGKVALSKIHYNMIDVGGFRASVVTDGDVVKINDFSANALGGRAAGKAEIGLEKGSNSNLSADLKNFSIEKITQLATHKASPVTGTLNGKASLNWKGVDFKTTTGQVAANFSGEAHPSGENAQPAPFSGNADIAARGTIYDIRKLEIDGASSQIAVNGSVTSQLVGALNVDFKSQNMATAQQVAQSFGVIPESVNEYQLQLDGSGSFNGTVNGKLTDPAVSGKLALDSIKSRGDEAGRLTASLDGSTDHVKVNEGAFVRPDGSRIDFTVDAPLKKTNAATITANIQRIDLPFIAKAVDPDLSENLSPLAGTLNGSLTLSGLPGSAVNVLGKELPVGGIHGKLNLNTAGLIVKGEPVERAGGSIGLDDRLLTFNDFALRYRAGQFDINGSVNTDSLNYDITAKVTNLSLDYFKEVSEKSGSAFPATGLVNAELSGKGNLSKNEVSFKLNATGQNITIHNEPIANPTLVVDATTGDKAKLDLNAIVRDQPHHITGTVDLLNDDGPVIHAEEALNNTSLAPYLALAGNVPDGTAGTATGKISVDGTISDFADPLAGLSATLDLQALDLKFGV